MAAAAQTISPASRLHRHALESILSFCTVDELEDVIAVSRGWKAATFSMPSLQLSVRVFNSVTFLALCHSRLRRHVSSIHASNDHHASSLLLLSQYLPHLRGLHIGLEMTDEPLTFPSSLTELHLHINCNENAGQFADAVAAIASLEQLEQLQLEALGVSWPPDWSVAALLRLPRLRRLALIPGDSLYLSDTRVAELRAFENLESFTLYFLDKPTLTRLLQQPHAPRWCEIGGFQILTESISRLLVALPLQKITVTDLDLPHVDFITQFPQLTKLEMGISGTMPLDSARIWQAVGSCRGLRSLSLRSGLRLRSHQLRFTSAQLGACLAQLEQLQTLTMHAVRELPTLAFLRQSNLPRTLTELRLGDFLPRVSLVELPSILQLRELRILMLRGVFDAPLGIPGELLFKPPVQPLLMPQLRSFEHSYWAAPQQ